MRLRSLTALALLALPAAPAGGAAKKPTVDKSRLLWATINVCDTPRYADTIGVRAQMPGSGRSRERMFMRFEVHWFDTAAGHWRRLARGGDSGFVPVGSARFRTRQAGRTFVFRPPAGRSWRLRGAVTFEWRRDGAVVRRARKATTAGHRSAAGSDPRGYSAADCVIS